MEKVKHILIIGNVGMGKSCLQVAELKEKYGEDINIVTEEEAREQGLIPRDFANLPSFEIKSIPEIPLHYHDFKTGQQNRREKRKQQRINFKK